MASREEIPDDSTMAGVRTPETWEDEEQAGTPEQPVEVSWDLIRQEDIWRARALHSGYEPGEDEELPNYLFPPASLGPPTRRYQPVPGGSDQIVMIYGTQPPRTGLWRNWNVYIPVEGDHSWMDPLNGQHTQIHWTSCYQDNCLAHMFGKLTERWKPKRWNAYPVPRPYLLAELNQWTSWDRNSRFLAMIPDPHYPITCVAGRATPADCPTNTCRIHAPMKALNLSLIRGAPQTTERGNEEGTP